MTERLHPDDLRDLATAVATALAATRPDAPSPAPEPALLDAKGAASLLNVPASWVLAEARAGRIPHLKLGKYTRFEPDELEEWWRSRARGPRRRGGVG